MTHKLDVYNLTFYSHNLMEPGFSPRDTTQQSCIHKAADPENIMLIKMTDDPQAL
jgi:hypothetical protein